MSISPPDADSPIGLPLRLRHYKEQNDTSRQNLKSRITKRQWHKIELSLEIGEGWASGHPARQRTRSKGPNAACPQLQRGQRGVARQCRCQGQGQEVPIRGRATAQVQRHQPRIASAQAAQSRHQARGGLPAIRQGRRWQARTASQLGVELFNRMVSEPGRS